MEIMLEETNVSKKDNTKTQGSPVSSKAEKTVVFSTVFSAWKKQFLPVSSAKIQKKLKTEVK